MPAGDRTPRRTKGLALTGIRRRRRPFRLSPIKEIELAAVRQPGAISLAQGIPDFDTPEVIKAYVKDRLDAGEAARYSLSPGLQELREQVAQSLTSEGMRYNPEEEILITAGAIEGIAATLVALTDPGQEVILPSPSYASYQEVIRLAGCEPCFVPLDEDQNFDLDVDAIAKRINQRTAAIFYCNPNNPTGTIYSEEQSRAMLELAERHDLFIITDEVYKDFCYHDGPYFSPAQLPEYRQRVVRIFSFSKAYAMTGWRVGYLHTAAPVMARILAAHDSLITCAPVISQHAAMAALLHGKTAVAAFRQAFRARRNRLLSGLDQLTHVFDYQRPNGAYFVFPRIKDTVPLAHDSRALAFDLLARTGLALVPGISFGPTGEQHLRISFGRAEADLDEGIDRLRHYFSPRALSARTPRPRSPVLGTAAEPSTIEQGSASADSSAWDALPSSARSPIRGAVRAGAARYLGLLARYYLWRRRPGVVAIAGNQGKTVTKRTLARALAQRFAVRANPHSYNTEIGLPLGVLGLEINPRSRWSIGHTLLRATVIAFLERAPLDWLILELGVRQTGDMAALLRIAQPDWAVVTHWFPPGTDSTANATTLRGEMAVLAQALPPERLIYSADEAPATEAAARPTPAEAVETPGAPTRLALHRYKKCNEGYSFTGKNDRYDVGDNLVGTSSHYAVQAAIVLGEQLGLQPADLRHFLQIETGAPDDSIGNADSHGDPDRSNSISNRSEA